MRRIAAVLLIGLLAGCAPADLDSTTEPSTAVSGTVEAAITPTATVEPTSRPHTPIATPIPPMSAQPSTGEVTFELLTQAGGCMKGIAINGSGTLAYVGIGSRVVVFDITNLSAPTPIAQSAVLPGGRITALVIQETTLYVAAGASLVALDVANEATPQIIQSVSVPGRVDTLVISGDDLFASGIVETCTETCLLTGFLARIKRATMESVSNIELLTPSSGMAIKDTTIYVGISGDLLRIDVSDPITIGEVETLDLGEDININSLRVYGDFLVIGNYESYVIYHLGDPVERVWTSWDDNIDGALYDVSGTHHFTIYQGHLIGIGPIPAGNYIPARDSVPVPDFGFSAALPTSRDMAIVRDTLIAVEVYELNTFPVSDVLNDTERGRDLVPLGSFQTPISTIGSMEIANNTLYLSSQLRTPFGGSVVALSLPNLDQLSRFEALTEEGGMLRYFGLDVAGDRLYVTAADNHLYTLNADPANMTLIGRAEMPANYTQWSAPIVAGEFIYAIAGSEVGNRIKMAALLDPNIWALSDEVAGIGTLSELAMDDDLLVASTLGTRLHFFEPSADTLTRAGEAHVQREIKGIDMQDRLIAFVDDLNLHLISVEDPATPITLSIMPLPSQGAEVVIAEGMAYVLCIFGREGTSLLAYNISDPRAPRLVGEFFLPALDYVDSDMDMLAVSGDTVVVGGTGMGAYVFRTRQP